MASKASTIHNVDYDTERVTYTTSGGATKTDRFTYMSKVDRIAVLQFVGFRFTGRPPMHWNDMELAHAWATVLVEHRGNGVPSKGFGHPEPEAPKATPKTPKAPKAPKVTTGGGSLDEAIRTIVTDVIGDYVPEVSPDSVADIVRDLVNPTESRMAVLAETVTDLGKVVRNLQPKVTEVHLGNGEVRKLDGVQHCRFPQVLAIISERIPTYLVGPAGTGKSTIAEKAAQALGLEFSSKSCSSQSTESSLLGYMNAHGDYVTTEFRKRFEQGGVFLLDEVDNGNPNILTVLNSALANSFMAFPDGMVARHKDFVLVATANTFGRGGNSEYVGRNALDAAFLDRFASVHIGYDEAIERAMLDSIGLPEAVAGKFLAAVRQCRANVESYGLKMVVSPRAVVNGARMLRHGDEFAMREVLDAVVLKGANEDTARKVLEGVAL